MEKLKNKVETKIKNESLIDKGDYVILGLSGGPDSVCLFHILKELEKDLGFRLYAVHVNHNLRKKDSANDQKYVEDLCKNRNVKCWVFSKDCQKLAKEKSISVEEAGRNLRYQSFQEAKNELVQGGAPEDKIKIAVAHNLEDQAETIIFRILRGTGIDGLAGMKSKGKGMFGLTIVRPLIDSARKEIEDYCKKHELKPREDATNAKSMYSRNKIRLELLPKLKEDFNPNIVDSIVRLGQVASQDKEYLWKVAEGEYRNINTGELELDLSKLRKLDKPIAHRIYEMILRKLNVEVIEKSHIEAIDAIVYSDSKSPSLAVDLPGKIKAAKVYDKIVFLDEKELGSNFNIKWEIKEMSKADYDKIAKSDIVHAAFDKDKLGDKAVIIRNRCDGDIIKLKNLGTKKLQDFFVDNKLPKIYRDEVLIASCANEVLWILPCEHFAYENLRTKGRMTEDYAVTGETKRVIYIEKTN